MPQFEMKNKKGGDAAIAVKVRNKAKSTYLVEHSNRVRMLHSIIFMQEKLSAGMPKNP